MRAERALALTRRSKGPLSYIMPRILIVEDDAVTAKLFVSILNDAGFETESAWNGCEAMQHLKVGAFDLMITDLVMPEFEGLELISRAKILHPNLKMIAISGAWEGEYLETAAVIGAHHTLEKPVSSKQLLEVVSGVLSRLNS